MKKKLVCFVLIFVLQMGAFVSAQDVSIEKEIAAGNFAVAKAMINEKMVDPATSPKQAWELLLRREVLDRIELDFRGSEKDVLDQIRRYYPNVTSEQLARWKAEKSLEVMTINGRERYFHNAAPNFFRLDKDAIAKKGEVDGPVKDNLNDCLSDHLPKIIAAAKAENRSAPLEQKRMFVTYTLTVPANTVPEGETLRCWLPYPREDHRRQGDVEFVDSNLENAIFSPQEYKHCSVYSEKIAAKDEPTVFQIQFRYTAGGEYFDLDQCEIKPYDKNSDFYKEYTAEREKHVIFTDEIKQLSEQFVGDEKDPVKVVRKIFKGITSTYLWASAREYSTVDNIPVYVIDQKHGDCGMVGLLLVTMCRYNGIPAKWQSGFMMHPGAKNLHDWAEVYFEGLGWVPIDPSFGRRKFPEQPELDNFFCSGIDSYRWIVNDDYGMTFYPAKIYPRSETVDFQRGEVEWRGGNLYFNQWRWGLQIEYEN